MGITHTTGGRLGVLASICLTLALAAATSAAAYPTTPDGEPLHLEPVRTQAAPPADPVQADGSGSETASSTPANAVPLANLSPNGTDWIETAMTAVAALALLALAGAAYYALGGRHRAARDPFTRERS